MTTGWIRTVVLGLTFLLWRDAVADKTPPSPRVQQQDAKVVEVDQVATAVEEESAREKPELPYDWITLRHLAMEWGHLAAFALWLAATGVGLLEPTRYRPAVLGSTWAAFAVEGVTGFYKLEQSTPFATPLRLFSMDRLPRVFFADDYAATLVAKHLLIGTAMMVTLILTIQAWRTRPGDGIRIWRALLGVNLVLALAIAAAATVLGFYHAIVVHFS